MSDFPDDVMKLAMQAAQGMGFEAVRVQPDVSPIAKAILAERERCADVAMNEPRPVHRQSGWKPIDTAPENRTVLLWMVMADGTPIGPPGVPCFDIGWLEDGDWMLSSKDNEPNAGTRPSHWAALPPHPPTA